MSKNPTFKTRARILNQLGEQLIKNESIALLELIKNSYDADATVCNVELEHPTEPEKGIITLLDDGEGMDFDTLASAWMEIGTSHKEDLLKNEATKRSHKFNRQRLGEKGIGRLGVHRLGRQIEIYSRKKGFPECYLKINWDDIKKSKYIEELPVNVGINNKPKVFIGSTGTYIRIKRFKTSWNKKMARECHRSILSLNSPFKNVESFQATFKIKDTDWLKDLLTYDDIKGYKLFKFDITLSGSNISKFNYKFTPWKTMNKLSTREITIKDKEIANLTRMVWVDENRKTVDINLNNFEIGKVSFKGVVFDLDSKILKLGVQDKAGLKKYLRNNGGIRVFRDNMRVMDYGELGNDWLDLGGRRVNMPAKKIGNNIIIASVFLERVQSSDLIEKANREGFVENEAYHELFHSLRYAIDRIESLRQVDKSLLRKFYSPKSVEEPVVSSINTLKDIVHKKVKQEPTRKEIFRYLDRIESDYEKISHNLMKSAGAGLNLIIVIHQIEKIIKEIKQMLKLQTDKNKIEKRVKTLADLVGGYSILIKKSDIKVRNLKGVLEQCVFNTNFRLEAHNIKLYPKFRDRERNLDAICSEDHFLNALMNIFDNSIWWLGYSKTKAPSIFVDISDEFSGYTSIVVADNGSGFSLPVDEIIKPFISDKPGGMGIGLHLTDQIMESLGGKLLFPEMDMFEIPEKFKGGAKIALAFRKKGEKRGVVK